MRLAHGTRSCVQPPPAVCPWTHLDARGSAGDDHVSQTQARAQCSVLSVRLSVSAFGHQFFAGLWERRRRRRRRGLGTRRRTRRGAELDQLRATGGGAGLDQLRAACSWFVVRAPFFVSQRERHGRAPTLMHSCTPVLKEIMSMSMSILVWY